MKKPEKKIKVMESIVVHGSDDYEWNLQADAYNQACDDHEPYIQSLRLSEEDVEKVIEKHKWGVAKYVISGKSMDLGKSSKDLAAKICELQRGKDDRD